MTKRIFIILFTLIAVFSSHAQRRFWEFGGMLGASNYVGDINSMFYKGNDAKEWNQFESSFDFYNSHFLGGLVARYNYNPRWSIRFGLMFSKISGDDKNFDNDRNLSFYSNIQEFSSTVEFNFLDYRTGSLHHRITPYIFAGIGLFHFNPKTTIKDYNSNEMLTIKLHDMHTEGQTFYNDKGNYSLWQVSIPFGLGAKFSLNKYVCIGIEWGFRKTFTDYIDDISSQYVGRRQMINNVNENAANVADRTHELEGKENIYHKEGEMRGNPTTDDWYNFFGVTITSRISNGNKKCLKGQ